MLSYIILLTSLIYSFSDSSSFLSSSKFLYYSPFSFKFSFEAQLLSSLYPFLTPLKLSSPLLPIDPLDLMVVIMQVKVYSFDKFCGTDRSNKHFGTDQSENSKKYNTSVIQGQYGLHVQVYSQVQLCPVPAWHTQSGLVCVVVRYLSYQLTSCAGGLFFMASF